MTARDEVHERLGHLLGTAATNLERGAADPTKSHTWIMEITAGYVREALDVIDRYFAEDKP